MSEWKELAGFLGLCVGFLLACLVVAAIGLLLYGAVFGAIGAGAYIAFKLIVGMVVVP